jgi:uncharacterized integral membrane protein (TIGR00698 family)
MFSKQLLPGLGITILLAAAAFGVAYLFSFGSAEVLALLFGIVLANATVLPAKFSSGFQFSEKRVLGWAIALMGLQLSFAKLNLSWWLLPVLIIAIAIALLLGSRISKQFGVLNTCGYMIGVGTAICGASAIAAVSPFLKTKAHETGVAIGVVNLLGTVGMLLLPALAVLLNLSVDEAGVVIGGSLQAVGQVVGAGYAMGDEVGEIATLVKLGRVLMLGPVVLFTALLMHSKSDKLDRTKVLPGFIITFFVLMIIANVFALPAEVLSVIKTIDKVLLAIAMAAIGLQIRLRDLLRQGPKALLLGAFIFVVQIGVMLAFVYGQNYFS